MLSFIKFLVLLNKFFSIKIEQLEGIHIPVVKLLLFKNFKISFSFDSF